MTRNELRLRKIKIEGKPLPYKVDGRTSGRKGLSNIENKPDEAADQFESFFDFDEELIEEESARKHFERIEERKINDKRSVLEEPKEIIKNEDSFILFEDEDEPEKIFEPERDIKSRIEKLKDMSKESKYEFRLCSFIKINGDQCKRQAPKDHTFCSKHRPIENIE